MQHYCPKVKPFWGGPNALKYLRPSDKLTKVCLFYWDSNPKAQRVKIPCHSVSDGHDDKMFNLFWTAENSGFVLAVNIQHLVIWTHLGREESWEFRACEMFGYLFSSYLYLPCALLFIAIPVQRWHDLWNLQGNVQRLRSQRGLRVLQIKHPNISHYLALFTLEVQRCLKIRKTAPISDVWPIFWKQHSVKINLL